MMNTGGLSVGGLLRIAALAQVGPLGPVVKEAEERALASAMAVDFEERTDAVIKQLEDTDHNGARTFSIHPLISSFFGAFV
jgi:hypothetical protein